MAGRELKILSAIIFLLCSISALGAWSAGSLFPWVHAPVFIAVLVILSAQLIEMDSSIRFYWTITVSILVGVIYRVLLLLIPSNLPAYDPDKFALIARLTLVTGDYRIPGLDFYGVAGAFHTFIAETAAVTGISPESAMVVIPVASGVLAPSIAAVFCLLIAGRSTVGFDAAAFTAALAVVATSSVNTSFWPVGQSLGILLFVTGIYAVLRHIDRRQPRDIVVYLILLAAMALTHKVVVLVTTVIVGMLYLGSRVSSVKSLKAQVGHSYRLSGFLVLICGTFLTLQYVYLTNYFGNAFALVGTILFSGFGSSGSGGAHPMAASPPDPGYLWIFWSHWQARVLLIAAFLAGAGILFIAVRHRSRLQRPTFPFLIITGTLVMLFVSTLLGVNNPEAVQPMRIFALGELLLVALVGVGAAFLSDRNEWRQSGKLAAVFILTILVFFNAFSAAAATDYPSQQRNYLTAGEMESKEFAADHVPTKVYSDELFVRQTQYPERITDKQHPLVAFGGTPQNQQFVADTDALMNGTITDRGHPAIVLRPTETVYRAPPAKFSHHSYQLEWDAESAADWRYNRVYTSGEGIVYRESDVRGNETG